MSALLVAIVLLAALAAGAAAGVVLARRHRAGLNEALAALEERAARERDAVLREAVSQRDATVERAVEHAVTLARERLGAERTAGARELDAKKELIDGRLGALHEELTRVSEMVATLERDRSRTHGELVERLAANAEVTAELGRTAEGLRRTLSSSQARGQWGERMADDILRVAGFVEGVNYAKQRTIEGRGTRPDVTFFLPDDRVLHMDVKFPIAAYLRFLEAEGEEERERAAAEFLRDVRAHVKDVARRGYVDVPAGTVEYALLFIPNESVYAFVHDRDPTLLDDALATGVVLCSPSTLFANLAVIRQATEQLAVQRTSDEVLSLLGAFFAQWEKYCAHVEKLGERIAGTQKVYDEVVGVRRRGLEKPLAKIEELRSERGLPVAEVPGAIRVVGDHDAGARSA